MDKILALTLKQPHALKGALKAVLHLAEPALLLAHPLADTHGRTYTVQHLQQGAKGLLIVHLAGISTPEAAAALGGTELFLSAAHLPPPPAGEVYLGSLVGRAVVGPVGQPVGTVQALKATPAHELLEITRPGHKPALVPIHLEYFENLTATPLVLTPLGLALAEL